MTDQTKDNGMSLLVEYSMRYMFAGVSCMTASFITNPVDVTKIRMQIEGELVEQKSQIRNAYQERYYKGILRGVLVIAKDEGIRGLYKGLVPALIREGSYSTIRIGSYEPIKRLLGATDPANTPFYKKLLAGGTAGAIGSFVVTPTDLIRVRLQAQGSLKAGEVSRYLGFLHALSDIYRAEGFFGLYRGTSPTVQRAIVVTATQVSCYDHIKHGLLNRNIMNEGTALHIVSAMCAGFLVAFTSSPLDVVKTRIMNQQIKGMSAESSKTTDVWWPSPVAVVKTRFMDWPMKGVAKNEIRYKNTVDCFIKTVRSEGIYGLYKGFIPNWMRLGPHTIISFFLFEFFRKKAGIRPI